MKVIGLAGRAGSGKTAASQELAREPGVAVIDLDRVAWETYRPRSPTYWQLVSRFGRGILRLDAAVDRSRLAKAAFRTERDRQDLDGIVHPAVMSRLRELVRREEAKGTEVLYVEGALLGSSPYVDPSLFTTVLWLEASDATRAGRLAASGRAPHAGRLCPEPSAASVRRISAEGSLDDVVARIARLVAGL